MTKALNKIMYIILPILSIIVSTSGCKNDSSGESAGKDFCECIKKNGAPQDYLIAAKVCEAQLIEDYYYFRIFQVDMNFQMEKVTPDETKDSALKFMQEFDLYTKKNCCDEIEWCKDSVATSTTIPR